MLYHLYLPSWFFSKIEMILKHSLLIRHKDISVRKMLCAYKRAPWYFTYRHTFLIPIFRGLIERFVKREYYTCISKVANRHVQNPLWNPFVDLRCTLTRFMRHFCMPIQLRRYYYDTDYYRNLQKAQSDANWSRLTFRYIIITVCCVDETLPSLGKFVYNLRSKIIHLFLI